MFRVTNQSCLQLLREAGHGLPSEAIITGSAAASLALDQFWQCSTVEVMVPEDLLAHLKLQEGWTQSKTESEVVNDAGTLTVSELPDGHITAHRQWQSISGLRVACLPETYVYLESTPDADEQMAKVRQALQTPLLPLPLARTTAYLRPELERLCPPEWQWDSELEPYFRLLATGVHIVTTCYGDPEVEQANRIIGDIERPEYGVRALYHNGFDLFDDMRWLLLHLRKIGVDPKQSLLALCGDAYSDAVLGYGRKRNSPRAHDELRSAKLARAHALQVGFPEEEAKRLFDIVLGTTFSWETGKQEGATSNDPLVRAVVGADLRVLGWPDSPHVTFAVAAEDGLSAAFSEERCIGRAMTARGVEPTSLDAVLGFVDRYPGDRPEINGHPHDYTVRQWFGRRFLVNADFHAPNGGYVYPSGWSFRNDEMRFTNAQYLRGVGTRVLVGASLQEEYQQALRFARETYEQFTEPE